MQKSGFDPEALVSMFASAGAKQSAQVKEAVTRATLAALQGRELTLKNIREALKNVSQAASTGMAKNPASSIDVEKLLNDAVTGMDQALLKAVEANQRALQQFVDQGADLKEKHLKKAIDDLDKFEDMLFGAIKTAAGTAGGKLAAPWEQVLERMKAGGTSRARRPAPRSSRWPRRCRRRCAAAARRACAPHRRWPRAIPPWSAAC